MQATPPAPTNLKRKKSLPDAQPMNPHAPMMPREEASVLSSQQRENIRRRAEETERYRANPFLYLTSPSVQVQLIIISHLLLKIRIAS